jgi:DNA-binding transcriptional ArsR family regulator
MPKSHAQGRELRQLLQLFALLAHPIRAIIFQRLSRQPSSAGILARHLPVSRVAVVQHVKRLERAGLLAGVRQGRSRIYHVRPRRLEPLQRWLATYGSGAAPPAHRHRPRA